MTEIVKVHDKEFKTFISEKDIQSKVSELAEAISRDYNGKDLMLVGMLNGAFMFCSDLAKAISIPLEVNFVRYSSYKGLQTTGEVKQLFSLNQSLEGKHVIIVEDIVDTGLTMKSALEDFAKLNASSVKVASFLSKPECLKTQIEIDYVGFEIPEKFVIGYGLDYDGLGRNYKDIYQLHQG